MPPLLQRWLPLVLLAVVALGLRTWDLERRPMHADEANQAVKTGALLEGRGYAFDPADHHGPTLYYAALPVAWLRGERTLAALSETSVRLVPALAGTVAVVLLYFFCLPLGPRGAFLAGAFLALSSPAVYYGRYFVQESLLLAFTLGFLLAGRSWWRTGHLAWALAAGACAGLMQATKASSPLFLLAALLALAAARPGRPTAPRPFRDALLAGAAALLLAGLFYTSFGTNWRGLADALATYGSNLQRLSAGTAHEKPWWYYLTLLGWHRDGGVLTHQVALSAFALVGTGLAFRASAGTLLRGTAVFTGVLLVAFSTIGYKTPWHAVHFAPGLAVLAAAALATGPGRRWISSGLAGVVLLSLGLQVRLTSFQRPADERNPYAYVHTSPDVLKLRPLVEAALAAQPAGPVRVISEESWPLPWYLRGLPNIGYWTDVPAECDGALIIASAGLATGVQTRLHGKYETRFVGLRPGFTFVVFRRSL
jgi:uncharacterized protein (TIGR03663 family)